MIINERYMSRCLQLAELGAGSVAPNPMVGAVLVYDNRIIGEGYHKKYGEAHAEVNCISSVKAEDIQLLTKATLYVSLEPCSHFGKTPPCTDLILKNAIPKVAVGCRDIYKEVDGRGIQKLKEAGTEVTTEILEKECRELNRRFFTFHQKQRPYIILKWAQSVNGKIGSKDQPERERIWISNEYTNRVVHKWRSEEAAIMVGTNTALHDDPALTTRLWKGKNPIRIVVDTNLRLPAELKIFDAEATTIIFNSTISEDRGNLIYYKTGHDLHQIMTALYKMNIQSVLVEGGAKLLQSFFEAGLWDEARVICNQQMIIKDGVNAPEPDKALLHHTEKYLNDTLMYFRPL